MFKRATPIDQFERFSDLPVRKIASISAARRVAVHVSGDLTAGPPLVCLPGYVRNMLDFSALYSGVGRYGAKERAVVLIDLAGRGRSDWLPKTERYVSLRDAEDVLAVLAVLGITRAHLLGQGHGGQVALLVARRRPSVLAGTILVDSGPLSDPQSLVRMRNNHDYVCKIRGAPGARRAFRRVLSTDYPGEPEAHLEMLAERVYWLDRRENVRTLFDPRLIAQLADFDFDDVLDPQWALFRALSHAPLMLMRTQFTDQVRRATFEEMMRLRPDATRHEVPGQGSPALFEDIETLVALAKFLDQADALGTPGRQVPRPGDTSAISSSS
ncbi:alpha/beta fold hydrolase [Pelagibacterium montanilacus]|uniref:alpha/beta fold hydrolase n=1 Tax=Pelagibacterium montanilacus TaxID=2185280 RepID=UPI000F8E5B58|nr:alpha/beta hydrolase [Pelagibacterium montanilacus]